MGLRLCAVVVLYYPDNMVWQNIKKYKDSIDKLYLYDNTDTNNDSFYHGITDDSIVVLKAYGNNLGIAKAFNVAIEQASKDGFRYLLLMDQDSFFDYVELEKYKKKIEFDINYHNKRTAIYAPNILEANGKPTNYLPKEYAISSGSVLDLKEIGEIGKFKEEYFIYLVDVEYCKRATTRGYKIERYLDIYLHHQTNDINNNQYARKTNKLAYYYAVRNKHYFLKEYPTDGFYNRMKELLHTYEFWLSIAKREKTTKTAIVYMLKGVIGYIRQEKGKYPG